MWLKRLIRRIKWLCFYQWKTLTLHQWPYESCRYCGKVFHITWSVKDEYWQKVIGVLDNSGGSFCLDCFLECANKLKIKIPLESIQFEIFNNLKGEI